MKNSARCRWVPFLLVVLLGDLNVMATSWPLGTLTTNSNTDPSCPSGFTCHGFAVSCPGVSNSIQVFWALAPHQGAARGLVLFFTGCDGMGWWSTQSPELSALVAELRSCAVLSRHCGALAAPCAQCDDVFRDKRSQSCY